jgi:DNA-binding CsgD family transcriptional regulator/tetratricopeptide (TPR) repeat protein/type II secretory pathway predicted ATPase ExeA
VKSTGRLTDVRDEERTEVLRLTRAVMRQPDRAVLITGEAGIGKTHLARHVIDQLAQDGYGVAWGRADPVERAVPYAAIAQVLPDGGRSAAWAAARPAGPDAVLQQVFRPVAELLEARCATGPCAVAIDDLHYADEDTLVLIGFLVRRLVDLPLVWLFTARTHLADPAPGLTRLFHQLRDDQRLDEIELKRLTPERMEQLVEGVVGRSVDDAALAVIVERASGNPFFAIQLALSLDEAGRLGSEDLAAQGDVVPSVSRRVALLERVFPLGEHARAVARLASVCGDIDLAQLEAWPVALGLDASAVQDGFDRLVRADLLRPTPSGRYEFVHDLVRETLYDDLGPAERRRLHRVAAQSLLEQRSRGEPVDLVELARHLSLCSLGRDERAVEALQEAGDALAGSAPRSAALRYRQAINYLPDGSSATGLQVRLAQALHRAGDAGEVVRVCRQGLPDASGDARGRLTRYLAAALADTGAYHDAIELVDSELAANGASVVLLGTKALLLRLIEDFDGAKAAVAEAESIVRTTPERVNVLFQRLNLGVDIGVSGGAAEALAELERLLPSLDPVTRMMVHAHAAGAYAGLGESGQGADHLRALDDLATQGVLDIDWPWTFGARVALLVHQAQYDDATRVYERGAPEFQSGLRLSARNHAIAPICDVALMRRDVARLRRYAGDVVALSPQSGRAKTLALSKLDRAEGRPGDAVERLESVLVGAPRTSHYTLYLMAALIASNLLAGRRDAAADCLDEMSMWSGTVGTVYARLVLDLLQARMRDDVDAAREGLQLAIEHRVLRYEPDFRFHLGRLGVDSDANLTAAHRTHRALGAVDEVEADEAAMRRMGVRIPVERRADRFALSQAEQRVAELVAEGCTNRAIAERLAYSVKTIEAYLSRVYAKTGCANRVELARFLAQDAAPKVSSG